MNSPVFADQPIGDEQRRVSTQPAQMPTPPNDAPIPEWIAPFGLGAVAMLAVLAFVRVLRRWRKS